MTDISILNGKKIIDSWQSKKDARLALVLEGEEVEPIFVLIEFSVNRDKHFDCIYQYDPPCLEVNFEIVGLQLSNCKFWCNGMSIQRYYAGFSVYLESNNHQEIACFRQEILLHSKYLRDNEEEHDRFMTNTWYPVVKEISAIEYAALFSE